MRRCGCVALYCSAMQYASSVLCHTAMLLCCGLLLCDTTMPCYTTVQGWYAVGVMVMCTMPCYTTVQGWYAVGVMIMCTMPCYTTVQGWHAVGVLVMRDMPCYTTVQGLRLIAIPSTLTLTHTYTSHRWRPASFPFLSMYFFTPHPATKHQLSACNTSCTPPALFRITISQRSTAFGVGSGIRG